MNQPDSSTSRKDALQEMVDRFLGWKLPEDFHPDGGISFSPYFNVEWNAKHGKPPQRHEPIGTNLLTAEQAEQMLRHVAGPLLARLDCPVAANERVAVPDALEFAASFLLASVLRALRSESGNEGYPGIAHDLETMRAALKRVLDIVHHEPFGTLGSALAEIARTALKNAGGNDELLREARDYLHNARQYQGDIAVVDDPQKMRFAEALLARSAMHFTT